MTFEVIAVANKWPEADYYCFSEFIESLEKWGCAPSILGMGEKWGGLMTKPRLLINYLKNECKSEAVICVDAFDAVFAKDPQVIVDEWLTASGGKWTAGAERNCFPDQSLADKHPESDSSYRYLNSGFIISTKDDMIAVLESMNLDSIPDDGVDPDNWHPNDQHYYMVEFLKQPVTMGLDTGTRYVWNLCGVDQSNFDFGVDVPINRETSNAPGVYHFNGGSKTDGMQEKILKHLKLR